ncbi:copper-containing nitrite reductase [Natronoglomus mannanivorans]|uniref:Copper-containing nitrite reductase n=1 Tax=Natronoglomus mannanivorans TaxID=2979990 RepID=A0AAP2Z3X5_9EURY|nr:copper-containing nitrite reductase [Halobacteria archaeon AArc-xg1-1]
MTTAATTTRPVSLASRRQVLQGIGAAGLASVAGCLAPSTTASGPGPAASVEADPVPALDPAGALGADRIAADPTAIPAPIDRDHAETVSVELVTEEVVAEIEPGVTFTYMTFNGQIPGPLVRVREGDTVELTIHNHEDSTMAHNVDFHATRGPGGGGEATLVVPGETARLRFEATYPGAFIYHCAVPNVDYHIAAGMYGVILVEPEEGLPEVDHELYFGQHELYTVGDTGEEGHHDFSFDRMADEDPTYVALNGSKAAITPDGHGSPTVAVGDTVRVIFGCGGPNLPSYLHPIGSVWDEAWATGSLASDPELFVETSTVAPGSAFVGTMSFPVPGDVKLVDHALSRVARKGALAVIHVEGDENPEIFDPDPEFDDDASESGIVDSGFDTGPESAAGNESATLED